MHISADRIRGLIAEYRSLREAGEHYGALLRLAQVKFYSERLSPSDKASVGDSLGLVQIEERECRDAAAKAAAEAKRLLRLLETSGTLVMEEVYLVVTLRIDLGLMSEFLSQRCGIAPQLPIRHIDDEILEARRHPKIEALFASVVRSIHKNSGLVLRGSSVDDFLH